MTSHNICLAVKLECGRCGYAEALVYSGAPPATDYIADFRASHAADNPACVTGEVKESPLPITAAGVEVPELLRLRHIVSAELIAASLHAQSLV